MVSMLAVTELAHSAPTAGPARPHAVSQAGSSGSCLSLPARPRHWQAPPHCDCQRLRCSLGEKAGVEQTMTTLQVADTVKSLAWHRQQ